MIYIAGYKGKKRLLDRLIRLWTGDEYSHCELVVDGICFSSSYVDGGVRSKTIDINDSSTWDLVPVEFCEEYWVTSYYKETNNKRYRLLDLALSQVLKTRLDFKDSEFCSEWCATALGIPDPRSHTPGSLIRLVKYINWVHRCAKLQ